MQPQPEFKLRPDRLKGLLSVKGLKRKELVAVFGVSQVKGWFLKSSSPAHREPTASDAVALGVICEVPVAYLFGAATKYDSLIVSKVAVEASLDSFLDCTTDGREVTPDLVPLLRRIADQPETAPKTVTGWRTRYEDLVMAVRFGEGRNAVLNQMLPSSVDEPRTGSGAPS
jgi:hypothetical protein